MKLFPCSEVYVGQVSKDFIYSPKRGTECPLASVAFVYKIKTFVFLKIFSSELFKSISLEVYERL